MKKHVGCRSHHKHSGLRFSFFLIIVGLAFLAINTGIIPTAYKPLLSHWPIWVIFGGLFFLTKNHWFMSISMLSVGTFFIIPEVGAIDPALNIPPDFTHLYWPLLLVVAGIYMIICKFVCYKWPCAAPFYHDFDSKISSVSSEDGYIKISSSFDSRKHIVLDPLFKGGKVESAFGEVILDLRKTNLPEGKTILQISVSFGSIQIVVPSNWNVQMRGDSMFGTFNESRFSPSFNPDDSRILIIEGKCAFGECRLRD
jgi:predicted membrane protein